MKIYLDENLSEYIAEALASLSKVAYPKIEVHSTKTIFRRGEADEVLIPKIGAEGSILITKDFNIKKTQLQFGLCQRHGLGIFFLTLPKGQDKHWETVKVLINNWEEIVQKSEHDQLPFAYRIRIKGKMEKLKLQ